jgi:hypothetical protein
MEGEYMSNALGLTLIGMGIATIIVFVVVVSYMARNYPDTPLGAICSRIDRIINNLPDDF